MDHCPDLTWSNVDLGQKNRCNRDISSRRIDWFFTANLYDHQEPIAMGGRTSHP